MASPDRTAALVMDDIPMLMRLLRLKYREKRAGDLSLVQFRTLAYINAQKGTCLSEVAGHIGLGLPTMSKLVDSLVRRDLITRSAHGHDRRRVCLSLTPQGEKELEEAYRHTQSFFAEKFAQLSEEERLQIVHTLEVMQSLFDLESKTTQRETPESLSSPDLP